MLHVDFEETDRHSEDSLVGVLLYIVENMLYGTRYYSELILGRCLLPLFCISQRTSIVFLRKVLVQIALTAKDGVGLS